MFAQAVIAEPSHYFSRVFALLRRSATRLVGPPSQPLRAEAARRLRRRAALLTVVLGVAVLAACPPAMPEFRVDVSREGGYVPDIVDRAADHFREYNAYDAQRKAAQTPSTTVSARVTSNNSDRSYTIISTEPGLEFGVIAVESGSSGTTLVD